MKRKLIHLTDPVSKAILYVLKEKDKERPVTVVCGEAGKYDGVSSSSALRRTDQLLESGLIKETNVYQRRYISLTDKGKKVVEYLKKIDEVMEG